MSSSNSVFDGPRLTFERKDVFGAKYAKRKSTNDCIVTNILEAITFEGSIKGEWVDKLDKQDLWLYIHYLWFHNHETNAIFQEMRDGGKASAVLFVKILIDVLHTKVGMIRSQEHVDMLMQNPQMLENTHLATFVNYVIQDASEGKGNAAKQAIQIPAISKIVSVTMEKLRDQEAAHDRAFDEVQSSLRLIEKAARNAQKLQPRVRFVENLNDSADDNAKNVSNAKSNIVVKLVTSASNKNV